ncbi:hypothetical protein BV20DRAFT_951976 [Pilatotrama ljubarskyi]|nr:hypothetical protein BV20DRAFT_951976 [Pilatotrama ljubarskyi]
MPSRSKKQSTTIVVRPIEPGSKHATKQVLGTLSELNRHVPLVSTPLTFAPYLRPRPLPPPGPPLLPPFRYCCDRRVPRPHLGCDDSQTWTAGRSACRRPLTKTWMGRDDRDDEYTADIEQGWVGEDAGENEGDGTSRQSQTRARQEVHIMDIAKPMKPRGAAKEFEIVDTVRRVLALEDQEKMMDWAGRIEDDFELDEWETLDFEEIVGRKGAQSYADVLR